jgi:lipopolysaccharide/colanic/teichoic acid biosynthesis glycosyltransferase
MDFFEIFLNRIKCYYPWQGHNRSGCYIRRSRTIESALMLRTPIWKRIMDVTGSICAIVILSPLLVGIAILIKTVSSGPVFFFQQRIGRGGKPFDCYKFRTMKVDSDTTVHQQYLEKLIGSCDENGKNGTAMNKLAADNRIIKFGNILRAAGVDELPQLFNVLRGQMSLVGPRPPIPYEVARYRLWNNARFDVAPGLTGLWQVSGKNQLGFNEMIRLDIKYAIKRSFLLDCKILIMTPYAVYQQLKEFRREHQSIQRSRYAHRRLP